MIVNLACDYDETLASNGRVGPAALEALERLRSSGAKRILITGRELEDLIRVFPQISIFDLVVAENGALLYRPGDDHIRMLAGPPNQQLLARLRQRDVRPLSAGHTIIATIQKHESVVREVIDELNLAFSIVLNRDSLMVLPAGVDKSSGFRIALEELEIPADSVVGVGDAENDAAFLKLCGCYVAVANALPEIRHAADFVTNEERSEGVIEVIDKVLDEDFCLGEARR